MLLALKREKEMIWKTIYDALCSLLVNSLWSVEDEKEVSNSPRLSGV
jgi:outer membrane lipopolysaccharide assembly protein LptE/RlpB